jgi:hypothetical protein
METTHANMLVIKDQAGEYYLLPLEMLQRGRVPEEKREALEAQLPALQTIGAADDDAQGHLSLLKILNIAVTSSPLGAYSLGMAKYLELDR